MSNMENTDIKTREGFVVMRCDVEMGYTNDEPICIMLENTYESRLKAANECGLYGEAAEKFAREKCWETKDRLTTYSIYKTDVILLDDIMNSPEVKAMIDKCNELGDEIKQLKEKCKKLEVQKKKLK